MQNSLNSTTAEPKHGASGHIEYSEQTDIQEVQVASVSFQDALAKEQPNPWNWASWTLYGVILVTTLSMFFEFVIRQEATNILPILPRLLYEWL